MYHRTNLRLIGVSREGEGEGTESACKAKKAAQSTAKPTCGDGSSAGCSEAKQNKAKQSKAKVEQIRAEQSKTTLSCDDGDSGCSGSKTVERLEFGCKGE